MRIKILILSENKQVAYLSSKAKAYSSLKKDKFLNRLMDFINPDSSLILIIAPKNGAMEENMKWCLFWVRMFGMLVLVEMVLMINVISTMSPEKVNVEGIFHMLFAFGLMGIVGTIFGGFSIRHEP